MGSAIGQRVNAIIRCENRLQKIEIAVGVIQQREIDKTLPLIGHHGIIGEGLR